MIKEGRKKMNRYDELVTFRIADTNDIDAIMNFIREYWSASHILANDKEFFCAECCTGSRVNYLLAENRQSGQIEAIMGFQLYSKEIQEGITDFSGGILKVHPDSRIPFLGMEMPKRLFGIIRQRAYIGNGANPVTALPLEKRILKHYTGRLRHFYRLSDREDYKIACIAEKKILEIDEKEQLGLTEYHNTDEMYRTFDDESFKTRIPYKDRWFIEKRYFNHPVYQYKLYGIGDKTVLAGREVSVNDAVIFRITDILGDCSELYKAGMALQDLISQNEYEYIDIYEHGISDDVMHRAGFIERLENDTNVIPNYFEPLVRKNVEIYFHTDSDKAVIFKADGDQDRPNQRV